MNHRTLLLLNFSSPSDRLETELCGILQDRQSREFSLLHETGTPDNLPGLILRCDPALVFLIFCPARLPEAPDILRGLRGTVKQRPLVVVTEPAEPRQMYEVLQQGAADFITPPLTASEILPRLWRLLGSSGWVDERDGSSAALTSLVGRSEAFQHQLNKIPQVARCDATVLIAGETGTGKELFARAIHQLSRRASRPMIPVNCGAIPVDLVENELFGHERGAFTGASSAQPGLIEEADGGTLFLDEVDSLPLLAQVKLLRFLQEKEYRRLGSNRMRAADARVITATNVDIEGAVQSGRLRQDLYYRLNIIALVLPPLRERRDDIPMLAEHFRVKYASAFSKLVTGFNEPAQRLLTRYDWPGNVRELEHAVERAVALCDRPVIGEADLDLPNAATNSADASFRQAKATAVAEFERTYLQSLLLACQGNITEAARVARKNRRAFWELLRKHHIDAREFKVCPN